jgi:hypothetical protein
MGQNSHQASPFPRRLSSVETFLSRTLLCDGSICFRLIQVVTFDKYFLRGSLDFRESP